jgi:DNA-binding XRE family transcriptional regulator
MTQKMAKKNGPTRETLADVEREMAKPRLAVSVREAVQREEEDAGVRLLKRHN